ncbi:MAG: YraN family protein [Alphaproteobacteria bacterium]|nr:YraN family protein [Alphaproteobacteria bacterium]
MNVRARRGAAAHRRGAWAERLCLWHLRLQGYRILARRYRTPVGEIDLIARRGRTVAAIEVKARADDARAAEAILWKQRGRIARALEHFLKSRPELGGAELRFDVMLVAPRRWPRHLRNAWRVGE